MMKLGDGGLGGCQNPGFFGSPLVAYLAKL